MADRTKLPLPYSAPSNAQKSLRFSVPDPPSIAKMPLHMTNSSHDFGRQKNPQMSSRKDWGAEGRQPDWEARRMRRSKRQPRQRDSIR
jgi:hypothetical protein